MDNGMGPLSSSIYWPNGVLWCDLDVPPQLDTMVHLRFGLLHVTQRLYYNIPPLLRIDYVGGTRIALKPVLGPDTKVNLSCIPSLGMHLHTITRRHKAAPSSGSFLY